MKTVGILNRSRLSTPESKVANMIVLPEMPYRSSERFTQATILCILTMKAIRTHYEGIFNVLYNMRLPPFHSALRLLFFAQHVLVLQQSGDRVLPTTRRVRRKSFGTRSVKISAGGGDAADKLRQTINCSATNSSSSDGSGQNCSRPAKDDDAELVGDRVCFPCPISAKYNCSSKFMGKNTKNHVKFCLEIYRRVKYMRHLCQLS